MGHRHSAYRLMNAEEDQSRVLTSQVQSNPSGIVGEAFTSLAPATNAHRVPKAEPPRGEK